MRFPEDVPVLSDGVVTLRGHTDDDLAGIYEMCSDPLTAEWTPVPAPFTRADARDFVEHARKSWLDGTEWHFVFTAQDDGVQRFAGSCWLRDEGQGRAEVAYGSHPWARGRGLMSRAMALMVEWAFEVRHLRALSWWADRGNWASRRVAWRLGFSCLGPVESWMPRRAELRDAWVGTLGATDPRSPRHPWYDAPRIVGSRCQLRPHAAADTARIVEACNDERTRRWLRLPSPYGEKEATDFLESRLEAMAKGEVVFWVVADPRTDQLVGAINLFDLKPGLDAEVGYWTHPDARGRGLMSEAARLACRHAFVPVEDGGLGLGRVTACAAVGNAASRHVIESVGFTEYGVERQGTQNTAGELLDLARYDLLAAELMDHR